MTTVLPFRTAEVQGTRLRDRVRLVPRWRVGHGALPLADGGLTFATAGVLAPWGDAVGRDPAAGLTAGACLAAVWVAVLAGRGAYAGDPLARSRWAPIVTAVAVLPLAVLLLAALRGATLEASRLAALTVAVASTTLALHAAADLALARTRSPLRALLVGHPHGVRAILSDLRTSGRFSVVAICVSEPPGDDDLGAPVVTGLEQLRSCAAAHAPDAVVVVPCHHLATAQIRRLCWDLEPAGAGGPDLLVTTGLPEVGVGRMRVVDAGPVPLLRVRSARAGGAWRVVKPVCERALAAVGLVLLTPLLLLLTILIRLESPGPAIFRQTRIGKDGVPFTMWKLRTMCADAAELQASLSARTPADLMLFKMHADPRITRLGRFLRTYSLDELPQLVNVVRGQMALVGPRPALPCEVERYEPDAFRRLAVTPGMTGLWQVSGRSDLSWEESVRLDLRYVDDWTPGLDLRILMRTAGAVVGHRGAY